MSAPSTTPTTAPEPPTKRKPRHNVPLWVVVVAVAIASPLVSYGVFSLANYIEDTTTVTVTLVSWQLSIHGEAQDGYSIACQSLLTVTGPIGAGPPLPPGGPNPCPYRVQPGSDYNATILVSNFFENDTLTLLTPAPFHLVSTTPSLPVTVPASGIVLSIEIKLPTTAGQYSFTGTESFT